MVLSQAGDQVSAVWFDNWNVPIEGRITPDGRLVLNGRHCFTSDHAPDTEISVRAEMERAPGTDSFRGRAFWENYNTSLPMGSCTGIRVGDAAGGDLQIIEFRRASQQP